MFGCPQALMTIWRCVGLIVAIALLFPTSLRAQNMRNVLVLHTYNANMTANRLWSEAFHETFGPDVRNQLYEEYFDNDRLPEDDKALTERLREKYVGKKFDLVISLGQIPLNFVMQHGEELWPGALKICAAGDTRVLSSRLPSDITGVFGTIGFGPTLDLALQLMPNTRRVFYVEGVDPAEQIWHRLAAEDFRRFAGRVEITYLNNLSLPDLLDRLGRLPDHSVVIYPGLFRDASGHAYVPDRVCPLIASASNAPVYGTIETYVGCGIVGGVVLDVKALAEETARLGLRVLERRTVAGFPVERSVPNRAVVDWRQMQRWGISEGTLSTGTIVRFRAPSLWEQHKWSVLAALTAIVAQLALIIILIMEMRRRKRSDTAVKNLSGRLINAAEEERKRIARELHDDIGQRLSLVSLELDVMEREYPVNRAGAYRSLHEPLQQLNEVISDVHHLSHQLHSTRLQGLGLAMALKEVCQQLARQHDIVIQLTADNIPFPLQAELGLCFYRVAQEALNNSVKHSGSARVDVRVEACNGTLTMTIVDYGAGFDLSTPTVGLGLATMRERLRLVEGTLRVRSRPGGGTELTAQASLGRLLQPHAPSFHVPKNVANNASMGKASEPSQVLTRSDE
jgi:signal transduction histidine kinase